jgi:hypothetical protein
LPLSALADLNELVQMLGVAEFVSAEGDDHAAVDDDGDPVT